LFRANSSGFTCQLVRTSSNHTGNIFITNDGNVYKVNEASSSKEAKKDIKAIKNAELDPALLYDLPVVQFKYKNDQLSKGDPNLGRDLIGFVVEDLEKLYPVAVQKDPDDPDNPLYWTWSAVRMIPPMLKLIQDQHEEIETIKKELEALNGRKNEEAAR